MSVLPGERIPALNAVVVLAVALVAASVLFAASSAHATTYTVNSTDDAGDQSLGNGICDTEPFQVGTEPKCTLRAAIQDANAAAGADAITVPAGTFTLTRAGGGAAFTGDLDVTDDLTITGAGTRATSVVGGAAPFDDRVFDIQPGASATITGLTITGGKATDAGGGAWNEGDLTLDGVAVKGNDSKFGAGIASIGGNLDLTDSTVSGNSAQLGGGVVNQEGGATNITNSTISGNWSSGDSVGVVAGSDARINILNSTIASNTSPRLGGGILVTEPGTLVNVKNTIVAGNTANNCDTTRFGGVISSQGNNISSDNSCPFTQSTDKRNTNPRLGPLRNNGGPTDTRALLSGSPAIGAGANADCPAADQRGVDRPQGPRCDIGAYERPNSAPTAKNDAYKVKEDRTLNVRPGGVLRNDTDPDGDRLAARRVSGPSKGRLTLRKDGSFTYEPRKNFNGADRFVYEARDGKGGADRATATIKVRPVRG